MPYGGLATIPGMEQQQRHSRSWIWTAAVFLLFLVLYPLSVGPYVCLDSRGILPEWVRSAYRPIAWGHLHSPEPVRRAFTAYVNWWARLP